jgi:hypothetical protein
MDGYPVLNQGSKAGTSLSLRRVIVPPYCGVPRLSHQFPVAVVVVVVVVDGAAVLVVVVDVSMDVVVDVDVDVGVDVVLDVAQDASNIAATIKKLKPNQINLFFIFYLHFD